MPVVATTGLVEFAKALKLLDISIKHSLKKGAKKMRLQSGVTQAGNSARSQANGCIMVVQC